MSCGKRIALAYGVDRMIFSNTITLGNLIELVGVCGTIIIFVSKISSQFAVVLFRLKALEERMGRAEELNMIPVGQRREARARLGDQ